MCPVCSKTMMRESGKKKAVCDICHKDCETDARCESGHVICLDCIEMPIRARIKEICRSSTSKDPYEVLEELNSDNMVRTRFLKNHLIVGSALAAAFRNAGGRVDLDPSLDEIMRRGNFIPPKACGHGGDCGAAVSTGIFYSVITDTHPLTEGEQWGDVSLLTGSCLVDLGKKGGPRCCNRGALVSMKDAVDQVKDRLGVEMEWKDRKCVHKDWNRNCKGESCPFY